MTRLKEQDGAALIMMIAIMAILATLSAALVLVTTNTQTATATVATRMTAFNYAEAALSSGVLAVRTQSWPSSGGAFSASTLAAAYNNTYPSGPTATIIVYDNQNPINTAITWDKGSPTSASTPDGRLWVQASVTSRARLRPCVSWSAKSIRPAHSKCRRRRSTPTAASTSRAAAATFSP